MMSNNVVTCSSDFGLHVIGGILLQLLASSLLYASSHQEFEMINHPKWILRGVFVNFVARQFFSQVLLGRNPYFVLSPLICFREEVCNPLLYVRYCCELPKNHGLHDGLHDVLLLKACCCNWKIYVMYHHVALLESETDRSINF